MSDSAPEFAESVARDASYRRLDDELFQLDLSHENKTEIFADAVSQLSRRSQESTLIMETLSKWSPLDASRFKPRSASTILDTPFQLIFPHSALPSFEETGLYVRQYLAISYCWHSDEFRPKGHKRHGHWPISKPFVDAILEDKDHPREGIWMDQLCIDQESSVVKARSIAAMDVIYRSCIRLIVLLEDVFLDEREARLHEKYDATKTKFGRTWQPDEGDRKAFASFYNKVNSARWWQRAWCLHEFSVNDPWTDKRQCNIVHNATFIMNGPESSTVKMKWVNLLLIIENALYAMNSINHEVLSAFNGQYMFCGNERGDRSEDMRSSLMARHHGVIQKGSLYLKDRVSVVLNMSGLGLTYVGEEIETNEKMLYVSTLLALARGEISPLSMFGGPPIELDGKPTCLAQGTGDGDISIPSFKPQHLECVHRISTGWIELDMAFFNSPGRGVSDGDLDATFAIFPDTIRSTRPTRHGAIETDDDLWMPSHTDSNLDMLRRRFLGACIMNGFDFTTRLWAQLQRQVVALNYNGGIYKDFASNPALSDPAQVFLRLLLPTSSLLCIPPPQEFTLEDAQLFLTWLTDSRSMYFIGAYTYSIPCSLNGDHAFMTSMHVNEHFADGPAEELKFAIPTDVLDSTCMALRVWVLRPKPGEGETRWRLVGKALLLGEPELVLKAESISDYKGTLIEVRKRMVVGG